MSRKAGGKARGTKIKKHAPDGGTGLRAGKFGFLAQTAGKPVPRKSRNLIFSRGKERQVAPERNHARQRHGVARFKRPIPCLLAIMTHGGFDCGSFGVISWAMSVEKKEKLFFVDTIRAAYVFCRVQSGGL